MIAQAASTFVPPEVQWFALVPLMVVLGAGVVGVLVESFVPARARRTVQTVLTLAALVGALAVLVAQGWQWFGPEGTGQVLVLGGAMVLDGFSVALQGTILLCAFLAVLVVADRTSARQDAFAPSAAAIPGSEYEELARRRGLEQTEVYPLLLFAVGGMLVFPAAGDLVTMFVALEVLSLPLYVLAGMARRRRLLSQEASFKYFVLGAFASALFLFGTALLYGFSGSVRLDGIARMSVAVSQDTPGVPEGWVLLWLVGILLVLAGLLFKVGAVPFQAWTPDVYQGAPTPITGFMAACTKVAAFGALVRVVYLLVVNAPPEALDAVKAALWTVAVATMLVGAVVGATQTDVKRMLGYSSIAHAGFLLVAVLGFNAQGVRAVVLYLLVYGVTTVGAFAVVTLVREVGPGGEVVGEATHLGQWAGLGRRSPWLAASFSLFLLSFAGIPLTGGFIAKFSAFEAAVRGTEYTGSATPLVVVGVIASAIAVFFYVRVVVIMFFSRTVEGGGSTVAVAAGSAEDADGGATAEEPEPHATQQGTPQRSSVVVAEGAPAVTVVRSEWGSLVTVAVAVVTVVVVGVFPQPVLDLVDGLTRLG